MKCITTTQLWIVIIALACSFFITVKSHAAEDKFTIADYCALSVDRLQLVVNTLEQHDRVPTEDEITELCKRYNTTDYDYCAFRSAHPEEVDQYLTEHSEVKEKIEQLSARIQEIVKSKEESE